MSQNNKYVGLPVVNQETLNHLKEILRFGAGGNDFAEYLRLVLDIYHESVSAINDNDDKLLADNSHKLMSNTGAFGFEKLYVLCQDINREYKNNLSIIDTQKKYFIDFSREAFEHVDVSL